MLFYRLGVTFWKSFWKDEEGNDSLYLPLLRSLCDIDVDFNVSFDNSRSMFYFSYFRLLENTIDVNWLPGLRTNF